MKDMIITLPNGEQVNSCNVCHIETINKGWCKSCIDIPENKYTCNPVQTDVYKLLQTNPNSSFVVASKTGTGKSIAAWMAIRKFYETKKTGKIFILQPLKQLVREKISDLNEIFPTKKTLELTGDTSDDVGYGARRNIAIKNSDIVVTSYEMFDSLTRKPNVYGEADNIGLIIIDEIHSIGDHSRGGKLDGAVTRFLLRMQRLNKVPQIIALSATFDNLTDLCEYFQQFVTPFEAITSEFSPIKANIDSDIYTYRGSNIDLFLQLLSQYIDKDGGIMCMQLSIPGSRKLCDAINMKFGDGTATVHFSELGTDEKNQNVDDFNEGKVRVLCCTPTLLAGVNVGATVIFLNCSFFNPLKMEMDILPGTSIRQATGRVGRPPRFKEGWVTYIAQSGMEGRVSRILRSSNVIFGTLNSSLELVLNIEVHLNSQSKESLLDWYKHTYSGYTIKHQPQFGEKTFNADERFNNAIEFLTSWGFITDTNGHLSSTKKGTSVARHFVSPLYLQTLLATMNQNEITSSEMLLDTMSEIFSTYSSPIPWTDGKEKHTKSLFAFEYLLNKDTNEYDWNAPEPQVQWSQPTSFTMNGVQNVSEELGYEILAKNSAIINFCMKNGVIPYPLIKLGMKLEGLGKQSLGPRYLLYLKLNGVMINEDDGKLLIPKEFKSPSISYFDLYADVFGGTQFNDYKLRYKYLAEGLKKLYMEDNNGNSSDVN